MIRNALWKSTDYDCIIIGGGHAGIEASLAVSRLGFNTLLITQNPDRISALSCNPAVGGLSNVWRFLPE